MNDPRSKSLSGPGPDLHKVTRIAGLCFALVGVAAILELWSNGLALWDESGPGPAFAPGLLSVVLVVLGLVLASGRIVEAPEPPADDDEAPAPWSMPKFTLLLVGLIAIFPYLGGVVALSLFVALEMLWVERSSIRSALLSGAGAFAMIWLIFVEILAVPLPAGILAYLG